MINDNDERIRETNDDVKKVKSLKIPSSSNFKRPPRNN
jgi:hypothetical protein